MVKHSICIDLHKEVAQIGILDERGEVIREDRFCCHDDPSRKHLIDELGLLRMEVARGITEVERESQTLGLD